MTKEQKAFLMRRIAIYKSNLQAIEQGKNPNAQDLTDRRKYASWQLEFLLEKVVEVLPEPLRREVQECLDINQHVWSSEYSECFSQTQEKASPLCLAATDSL